MPKHTDVTASIPRTQFASLPKNIMDFSEKVDNKFLNDNLHTIEEMEYRKKGITDVFRNYQNKYYADREILNHDLYFTHEGKTYPRVSGAQPMIIQPFRFTTPVNGADLVTNAGESGTSAIGGSPYVVIMNKVKTVGTVGEYYDQVAINVTVAAGNLRLCVYKDNAGDPDARYVADTGSFAAAADYAWHSLTAFALTGTANWIAYSQQSDITIGYETQASGNGRYLAGTFAELADPVAGGLTNSTTVIQMKMGHS